nr:HDOD domain-containing protein [Pseudomonas sp. dw_358]
MPIPRPHYEKVRTALGDSRRSLREIADFMQESPALVLSVMREANQQSSNSLVEPTETLEVALNRLGLKRTEDLLAKLPCVDAKEVPPVLRQMQLISQHAAQQANGLFAGRMARLWQEIHWGSLLFMSPTWALAFTHPELLEEWELRVVNKGESAAKVERQLFGVPLLLLCRELAERWRLPGWVLHAYRTLLEDRRWLVQVLHIARDNEDRLRQQLALDDEPPLRRWLGQPANTVLLANGLAIASQQGWTTAHMVRWQYLASLYLQAPLESLQQQVHQHAAQSARHHAQPGLWHPALALIWPWDERRVHRAMLPAPPPTPEALVLWRKRCAELLLEPSRFNNAMHLTTEARDALVACGMQRVMLLMADKTQTQLRVQQLGGLPGTAASLTFTIANSTVLTRLMSAPAQIRLNPGNNAQFSALLPPSLRGLFRGDNLLLRSLSNNGRVVMLVVADQGGGPFSEVSVQAFAKTGQCIERALASFTNRSG